MFQNRKKCMIVNLHQHPGPVPPAQSSQEQFSSSHAVQYRNRCSAAPEEQLQVESPFLGCQGVMRICSNVSFIVSVHQGRRKFRARQEFWMFGVWRATLSLHKKHQQQETIFSRTNILCDLYLPAISGKHTDLGWLGLTVFAIAYSVTSLAKRM